jgi:hypothetical protein
MPAVTPATMTAVATVRHMLMPSMIVGPSVATAQKTGKSPQISCVTS